MRLNARPCRAILVRIVVVAVLLMLVGCGDDDAAAPDVTADDETEQDADVADDDDPGEPVHLTFTHGGGDTGLIDGTLWWAEEIESRSDGRITIEFFHHGALAPQIETLPAVRDLTADSGLVVSAQNPAQFPLWNVVGIPFETQDPHAAALSLFQLYQQDEAFRAEFDSQGVEVMHFLPYGHTVMAGTEPIERHEDFAGTRLRVIGHIAAAIEAAGGEATAMDPGEVYESIQRGVLDGIGGWPFDVVPEYGLHEVTPHVTITGVGHYAKGAVVINSEVWAEISQSDRELIAEVSRDLQESVAIEKLMELENTACEQWLEEDAQINVWEQDATQAWADLVGDGPFQEWRSGTIDAGVDESDVDAFYERFHELYENALTNSPYESQVEECV